MTIVRIVSFLMLSVFLFVSACITTPVSLTSSNTPLEGKRVVQNQGKVYGSDTAWSFLGLWMIGRPDIEEALQEALRVKGGDALTDVRCYETYRWFLIFSTTTVGVGRPALRPPNILAKTGTMKVNIPMDTSVATIATTVG